MTNTRIHVTLAMTLVVLGIFQNLCAQNFSTDQYQKAVWMTTRMYGGQRSGEGPNWLIMDHTVNDQDKATLSQVKGMVVSKIQPGKCFTADADGTYSLAGGWVDCGDHAKFGQTMFYAGYMLALAYSEFPAGFDDLYTWDYSDYREGNDFSWEGKKGIPNGIPDLLDELKYQTDFFIRCSRDASTFYSQVGMGDVDHLNWVSSVAMAALPKNQGGQADQPRDFRKNPNDCSMPALCAATLAVMSRVYRIFDPAYADTCLKHARFACQYAASKKGNTEAVTGGGFYPAKPAWQDSYAIMLAEMYRATGELSFKTEALSYETLIHNHYYTLCYNNCDDLAAYLLASMGSAPAKALLKTLNDQYNGDANGDGVFTRGPSWGLLRYTAAQAFSSALQSKLNNENAINTRTLATIEFIMGKNSRNLSFIVGFGGNHAKRPHHRNYYSNDNIGADQNSMGFPSKNAQFGYLVGGAKDPNAYNDQTTDYQSTEGGIDYNAGLVGALGYLVSKIAPVDINKFGHPSPDLGSAVSLCGTGSATLTATLDLSKLKPGDTISYQWFKGSSSIPFEQGDNKTSVTVTKADTYSCKVVEKHGGWETSGKVSVMGELPAVTLGSDKKLCDSTSFVLDAGVQGTAIVYQWTRNNTAVSGTQGRTLIASRAGTYTCSIAATGCPPQTDTLVITSSLPEVVNDTLCSPGTASLSVSSSGNYQWYPSPTGGTPLAEGSSFSPLVSQTQVYYVQDAGNISVTAGPRASSNPFSNGTNAGYVGVRFTAAKGFSISQVKVIPMIYGFPTDISLVIDLLDANGNTIKTYTSNKVAATAFNSTTLYTLTFDPAITIASPGNYTLMPANGGNQLAWYASGADFAGYDVPGVIDITDDTRDYAATSYPAIFDMEIKAGSSCSRAPVQAIVDPESPQCKPHTIDQTIHLNRGWNLVSLYVQPADSSISSIFGNVPGLKTIKTADAFFMPSLPAEINKLTYAEKGAAYLIFVESSHSFTISGVPVGHVSRQLHEGWNLVGYPRDLPTKLENITVSDWNNILKIKNFDSFYITNFPLSSLVSMVPGSGYFIHTSKNTTIEF